MRTLTNHPQWFWLEVLVGLGFSCCDHLNANTWCSKDPSTCTTYQVLGLQSSPDFLLGCSFKMLILCQFQICIYTGSWSYPTHLLSQPPPILPHSCLFFFFNITTEYSWCFMSMGHAHYHPLEFGHCMQWSGRAHPQRKMTPSLSPNCLHFPIVSQLSVEG